MLGDKAVALGLLALGELLAMGLWFSASASLPQLSQAWHLDGGEQSWLTMSVQIGFVVGAFVSAVLNLADRVAPQRLIALSTLVGALANGALALWVDDLGAALVLRFVTGVAMAGVYPPGMKLMASWCQRDRGFGIGLLVGALTVGSASPHLLQALPQALPGEWRTLVGAASVVAGVGALLVLGVRSGPHLAAASRFDWRLVRLALTDRPVRLANLGYLGHMWELYAMWAWVPMFLLVSYREAGWPEPTARAAGFAVIAVGGLGSVAAGLLADRWGRTTVTIGSLLVSGSCCLVAGSLQAHPALLTALCLVWGFAVVADSAQFSSAVSELSDPRYVGTALTVQTCLGFLLTLFTIRIVPPLRDHLGWGVALAALALGPVAGVASMWALRRSPAAERLASGNR